MSYDVFTTKEMAEKAVLFINNTAGMPIIGRSALTGKLQPDKQKTETWAKVEDDGATWIIPTLPDRLKDLYKFRGKETEYFSKNPHVKKEKRERILPVDIEPNINRPILPNRNR